MNELRLDLYLEQIEIAAHRAMEFVGHQTRDEFLADVKTQHAVAMSFAVMGEAAGRLKDLVARHAAETGSWMARRLIERWPAAVVEFSHVLPVAAAQASVVVKRA